MKNVITILINATVFMVIWIIGTMISNSLLGTKPPEAADPSTVLLLMWLCCLFESMALHIFMLNNRLSRSGRAMAVFIILFMLQFIFTQMESLYYLDNQTIPLNMILSTVLGGLILSIIFSVFVTFRYPIKVAAATPALPGKTAVPLVLFLGSIIYPLIYFLAGYFIAWQSEAVRVYYTGSSELNSFFEVMRSNFSSGVYFFQVIRGLIWTLLGILILRTLVASNWITQGLILGLLFALLMNAQLLLPNPYMPSEVRLMHGIETTSSNFIWGLVIAYCRNFALKRSTGPERLSIGQTQKS